MELVDRGHAYLHVDGHRADGLSGRIGKPALLDADLQHTVVADSMNDVSVLKSVYT